MHHLSLKEGETRDQILEQFNSVLNASIYNAEIGRVSASISNITFQRLVILFGFFIVFMGTGSCLAKKRWFLLAV